jgi:16S rRNA (cytosine967-C5)-methyltransferase
MAPTAESTAAPGGRGRGRGSGSGAGRRGSGGPRSGTARKITIDPARLAAAEVLRTVRVDQAYTNLVLPAAITHFGLTGRDAALATELASGSIRMAGTYTAIIAACSDRPMGKIEPRIADALRLGTHQLLSMRIPDHAAISTTVDIVRLKQGAQAAGFVNAVLRAVSTKSLSEWIEALAPDPRVDPTGYAAVAHSHPEWVVDELRGALGAARGELGDLLAADNIAPTVTLVARPGRGTREELPGEPTRFSPYGAVLDGGDPGAVAAVAEGRAGVQDEGSQLVAIAAATAELAGRDERWLDLCAGPGGKAAVLAGLADRAGAHLVANELQSHRTGLIARALRGGPGVAGLVTGDGSRPPYRAGSFDRVLVDAPCSGLGALRRRPEARWAKKAEDLVGLVMIQRALLNSAVDLARPGGVVLYATCSPALSETSYVVKAVLNGRKDCVLDDLGRALAVPDSAGPLPGTIQLWPHRHGTDAMFMALLRRTDN